MKQIARGGLRVGKGILLISVAFFAGAAKVSAAPAWWPPNWNGFFPWVVSNQFWLLTGPPVAVVIIQWIERGVENWSSRRRLLNARKRRDAELRELLSRLLSRMRPEFVQKRLRGDSEVDHRLTIFKANDQQTRLEIVARSSEATSGSGTSWRIDPNVAEKCEAVAGIAWHTNIWVLVPGADEEELPDVSDNPTNEAIEAYAKRTWVQPEQVRANRWKARSFAAIAIRTGGRRWGVLVLDSVDPHGPDIRTIRGKQFTTEMLGDIIQAWSKE